MTMPRLAGFILVAFISWLILIGFMCGTNAAHEEDTSLEECLITACKYVDRRIPNAFMYDTYPQAIALIAVELWKGGEKSE